MHNDIRTEVTKFLNGLKGLPYVVQFVTSIVVEGDPEVATQITSFLFTTTSIEQAREDANSMIESLSNSYRNNEGNVVRATCLGVHSVECLQYVSDDGKLELSSVQFSARTTPKQLTSETAKRADLPPIE